MLLRVEKVSKTYLPPSPLLRPLVRTAARQPVTALRGVSLEMAPGEVVGLVGPNGAGKSTLIRIIATLLIQTAGKVSVCGFDTVAGPKAARRHLGLVLEPDRGLYDRLTGVQNLEFFGVMSGLSPGQARDRARRLLELVGLSGQDKLVFGYSSGMRSRLSLARSLIADPSLLVLDEPTRSLDPLGSLRFTEALRELAGQGRAVLLSSHRLDEVASLCSRVIVLVQGEVCYDAAPECLGTTPQGTAAAIAALLTQQATVS